MITVALTGDVMLGRGVNDALARMTPEAPWGDVLPLLHQADVRIVNLECALTPHRQEWQRTFKVFHFRADPSAVAVLRAARIDACALANNHTLDFEEQGLADTLATLDDAGIAHAGAGAELVAAQRPAFVTVAAGHDHRVALVSVTDNEPAFAAGAERPGTCYLPVSLAEPVLARVERLIESARLGGADTVVFSNHWGPNMALRPPPLHRSFARAVIDRGADVYHGHSAHLAQGIELYRGRPILYDCGDFLDDYAVDPELRNDWSFLFRVCLESGSLVHLELWPVALSYARVDRATGEDRALMVGRMKQLCAELGTELVEHRGALVLPGRAPAHPTPR